MTGVRGRRNGGRSVVSRCAFFSFFIFSNLSIFNFPFFHLFIYSFIHFFHFFIFFIFFIFSMFLRSFKARFWVREEEEERKKGRKEERKKGRKEERKKGRKEERKKGRKEERKKEEGRRRRAKNAPTETGPLPQSHAQDLFVNRARGNPSLVFFHFLHFSSFSIFLNFPFVLFLILFSDLPRTLQYAADLAAYHSGQQVSAKALQHRWRDEIQIALLQRRAAMTGASPSS